MHKVRYGLFFDNHTHIDNPDVGKDFDAEYLENVKYYCLILSENYINAHFDDIKGYSNVIENRQCDEWCTMESVLEDNKRALSLAKKHGANYILIEDKYEIDIDL